MSFRYNIQNKKVLLQLHIFIAYSQIVVYAYTGYLIAKVAKYYKKLKYAARQLATPHFWPKMALYKEKVADPWSSRWERDWGCRTAGLGGHIWPSAWERRSTLTGRAKGGPWTKRRTAGTKASSATGAVNSATSRPRTACWVPGDHRKLFQLLLRRYLSTTTEDRKGTNMFNLQGHSDRLFIVEPKHTHLVLYTLQKCSSRCCCWATQSSVSWYMWE